MTAKIITFAVRTVAEARYGLLGEGRQQALEKAWTKNLNRKKLRVHGLPGFKGAFQCDYYSGYRHIGIGGMSGIKRLPCIRHIKRKFLDLKDNPQARK